MKIKSWGVQVQGFLPITKYKSFPWPESASWWMSTLVTEKFEHGNTLFAIGLQERITENNRERNISKITRAFFSGTANGPSLSCIKILYICVECNTCLVLSIIPLLVLCVFLQHIPIWILNSATPIILGQITHKPSLPPHLVGFLPFCTAWWEMMTSPGEQWSLS